MFHKQNIPASAPSKDADNNDTNEASTAKEAPTMFVGERNHGVFTPFTPLLVSRQSLLHKKCSLISHKVRLLSEVAALAILLLIYVLK